MLTPITQMSSGMIQQQKGLYLIAIIEAFKGGLALITGLSLHVLMNENIALWLKRLTHHYHLDPAGTLVSHLNTLVRDMSHWNQTWLIIALFIYATLRFVEAYGLWFAYRWTEWMALFSAAIYLPFEIYELTINVNLLSFTLLSINGVIVWYLIRIIYRKKIPMPNR
ncbi:MAG TPA: DUF2127 domain-containing protein [Methylophaga sp.]|nr:DUF2127 domain-containing protein [Methylophaga sp.]